MYAHYRIEEAWQICGDLFCRAVEHQISNAQTDIERELLFCLLGGYGITYEHARAATEVVATLVPFAERRDDHELFDTLVSALSIAQFEPPRRDGSLRRYRFPRRKATLIVEARQWLRRHVPLLEHVNRIPDCRSRRQFLCSCPGIGPKTASWLLRNLGCGDQLAIVDVHVLRALKNAGRVAEEVRMPRDYEVVEDAFLEWCCELAAPAPAFDLFLWEWQRGTLVTHD
ncbi:MAG: hypothetical protein M1305_08230 [Candidatus Marsarchaeota archaeon]|nr:hypothetical protein [Candidatus Marsarchaeota archaeon]